MGDGLAGFGHCRCLHFHQIVLKKTIFRGKTLVSTAGTGRICLAACLGLKVHAPCTYTRCHVAKDDADSWRKKAYWRELVLHNELKEGVEIAVSRVMCTDKSRRIKCWGVCPAKLFYLSALFFLEQSNLIENTGDERRALWCSDNSVNPSPYQKQDCLYGLQKKERETRATLRTKIRQPGADRCCQQNTQVKKPERMACGNIATY